MANVYTKSVTVTASYAALSTGSVHGVFEIMCRSDNSGDVTFRDPQGVEVIWEPGEWHQFNDCDLADIDIKGTLNDIVTINGQTI